MAHLAIRPAFRAHAPQFLRYCTVGVVNTILDFTIYTTLTRGWSFWRSHYLLANALSFTIVVTWSFFWSKYWTFRERTSQRGIQYIKFVTVTLGGVIIAQSVLFTGVRLLHLHDLVAKLFAGPLVVMWNFLMYRFWAFRAPSAGREFTNGHCAQGASASGGESPNGRSAYPLIREESPPSPRLRRTGANP